MAQWPPSPSVEDEETALAHEHSIDSSIASLKSDDQPTPSRGSIDQYPIIINTFDPNDSTNNEAKKQSGQAQFPTDTCSSDDSAGPPTPPPLLRKEERKPNQAATWSYAGPSAPDPDSTRSAPAGAQASSRGRPQIMRIQTDMGGNVRSVASGGPPPPSPYSFSRTSTLPSIGAGYNAPTENFLSPTHTTASPMPLDQRQRQTPISAHHAFNRPATLAPDNRTSTLANGRSKSERRENSFSKIDSPDSRFEVRVPSDTRTSGNTTNVDKRRSFHEVPNKLSVESARSSPAHSRRPSRESTYGSSGEERSANYRPIYSQRTTRDPRDSPYSSSAEDSSRQYRLSGERNSSDDQKKLRRKSSHRQKRPDIVEVGRNAYAENVPTSAIDTNDMRYYRHEPRDRSQLNPVTPITGDAGKAAMEDYFERALNNKETRWFQNTSGPRSSGSTLVSPMASPPRTPKSDRHSKDYFDTTPTTQRPTQRSRPPSVDEGPPKDPRIHSTLLSAATAGAALAARSSGTSPRSSGASTETSTSNSTSKPASAPRSRRPSPVREESDRLTHNTSYTPVDSAHTAKVPLTPTHDLRPISRGTTNGTDGHTYAHPHPHPRPHLQAQRAFSYSGPDQSVPWNVSHPSATVSPTHTSTAGMLPMYSNGAQQPRSARSTGNPVELQPPVRNTFGLPICPRSQPVVGYRDWFTIKEISDVDICPTCMNTAGNTRYRDLFVPSLPRPYNEPSVCAMSKPWVRIAFLQSLRQNRPDLSWVRLVTRLPKDTIPCAGNKGVCRTWYHVVDPQAKEPISDFHVCTACVRMVDEFFPDISELFDRPKPKISQEHSCSLHIGSKHFQSIIDQLEQAFFRCRGRRWRASDVEPLVRHVRRVARYQPCPRDEMQVSRAWHFMPDLPEFTVCEECYEEVVWPLGDRPFARDVSRTLKVVPLRRGSTSTFGVSCQLYSERMRKAFLEVVNYRDFVLFRDTVKTRVGAQQRLSEINKLYETDLRCGIDRRPEIEKNHNIWRSFE